MFQRSTQKGSDQIHIRGAEKFVWNVPERPARLERMAVGASDFGKQPANLEAVFVPSLYGAGRE